MKEALQLCSEFDDEIQNVESWQKQIGTELKTLTSKIGSQSTKDPKEEEKREAQAVTFVHPSIEQVVEPDSTWSFFTQQ